jgi:hypothetical protein
VNNAESLKRIIKGSGQPVPDWLSDFADGKSGGSFGGTDDNRQFHAKSKVLLKKIEIDNFCS